MLHRLWPNMCHFTSEILLTLMELTWTTVISWCEERDGPLKIVQTSKPTGGPLTQPGRAPGPSPPAQVSCLSRLGLFGRPGGAQHPTDKREWAGWGKIVDLSTMPNFPGGDCRDEPLSAWPAAFTVVWLTVGLQVWNTDLRGLQWVGSLVLMNVFLSVESGHLQSHLKNVHCFYFYVCSCPPLLTQMFNFNFHIVPQWQRPTPQVMLMELEHLAGFAFLLFFILL